MNKGKFLSNVITPNVACACHIDFVKIVLYGHVAAAYWRYARHVPKATIFEVKKLLWNVFQDLPIN